MAVGLTGLTIQVPVLNYERDACDYIWSMAAAEGLSTRHVTRLLSDYSPLILVKAYETRQAQKVAGIETTEETVDHLAAELEEYFGEEHPDGLSVPTCPIRESTPRNRKTRCLMSLASGAIAQTWRAKMIQAINEVYELDPGTAWQDPQYFAGVEAASFQRIPRILETMRVLLDVKNNSLPLSTELGALCFDNEYN